jgi:hypothetical protein
MLNAKTVPSNYVQRETLEAGTYPARLVQVIDLGLQPQSYLGEQKEPAPMIALTYELLDEYLKDEDGQDDLTKPRWITERFPLSNLRSQRAKSTARYNTLDPSGKANGDFSQLLGTPVNITIVLNPSKKDPTRVYENIGAVTTMRLRDAEKARVLVNPAVAFDTDDPDMEVWNNLPDWIKEIVKSNLRFQGSLLQKRIQEMEGDNKPVKQKDKMQQYKDAQTSDDEEAPW